MAYLCRLLVVICLGVLGCQDCVAETFQNMVVVQSQAVGYAITAKKSGGESIYKNPACFEGSDVWRIETTYASFFDHLYQAAGFSASGSIDGVGDVALTIPVKMVDGIPETIAGPGKAVQLSTFSDIQTAAILSWSGQLSSNLRLGVNSAGYFHRIGREQATGIGIDIGALYTEGPINLGFSVQNLGGLKLTWPNDVSTFEEIVNFGVGYTFSDLAIYLDTATAGPFKDELNLGGEFNLSPQCQLLSGIQGLGTQNQVSFGISLFLDAMTVHYAFSQLSDLGSIQKIGLGVDL
ncbi:MAG: hypothetical protein ACI9BD_000722, partial [Candidatus Marinamargulisbacteria bacterium]